MGVYLHNGEVAWEIPRGKGHPYVDRMFYQGSYLPPDGWKVEEKLPFPHHKVGVCGEMKS